MAEKGYIEFTQATDEQEAAIDALVESGDADTVFFCRGEDGIWLGAAMRHANDGAIRFSLKGNPPILQTALDGLMLVFDHYDEDEPIEVISIIKQEGDDDRSR